MKIIRRSQRQRMELSQTQYCLRSKHRNSLVWHNTFRSELRYRFGTGLWSRIGQRCNRPNWKQNQILLELEQRVFLIRFDIYPAPVIRAPMPRLSEIAIIWLIFGCEHSYCSSKLRCDSRISFDIVWMHPSDSATRLNCSTRNDSTWKMNIGIYYQRPLW